MPLSDDQIQDIVKRAIAELESNNPDIRRARENAEQRKTMKAYGFTQSPYGTKALIPSQIMRGYEAEKQASIARRRKASGLDTDEQ